MSRGVAAEWKLGMRHFPRSIIATAIAIGLAATVTPAAAAPPSCAVIDVNLTADACGHPFTGTLIMAERVVPKLKVDALAQLGVTSDPVDRGVIELTEVQSEAGSTSDLARALDGGALPAEILDVLTLSFQGAPSGDWYPGGGSKALPEPATWAMTLIGFAAAGFAIQFRRRRGNHLVQMA